VRLYQLYVAGYARRVCLVLRRQCARACGESLREMLSEKHTLRPVGDSIRAACKKLLCTDGLDGRARLVSRSQTSSSDVGHENG